MSEWVKTGKIGEHFGISRTKGFEIASRFLSHADPHDYIKEGKLTLLRIKALEEWWIHERD